MKVRTTATEISTTRSAAEAMLPVLPPLAALIEIAVLFGALVLGDWLHPGVELADIRPHPFWIPVLLLSVQYGTVSGLIAAAVAIGLTVTTGFPEQGTSETYFNYLLKIWLEPILWIAAAVLVGQFRMRQIAHKRELIGKVTELTSQRAAIADYARNLRSHCTALERQIASRNDSDPLRILQALDQTKALLADPAREATGHALAQLIEVAIPGAHATIYTADATGLRIVASNRAPIESYPRQWIGPTDPLYRTIVLEGIGASVLTREGEMRLAGAGVAAVPIYSTTPAGNSTARHVIGMLKIDEMPAAALTDTCLPALAALASPFTSALEVRTAGQQIPATPVAAPLLLSPSQKIWRHLRWLRGREPAPTDALGERAPRQVSAVNR